MIIRELRLFNFGVYRGEQCFELAPVPCDGLTRPVILIRGKNGSGKTTLMEAIRLCLHGSLAIGTRVSRRNYEDHLANRIHMPPDSEPRPTTARIGLCLEYVDSGYEHTYDVEREWSVVDGNVREYVRISEDGRQLDKLRTRKEKDLFLRELISPGAADLFFFDAEKLHTIAERETRRDLLADTVKALLGLNLVDRLQDDLDVYLSRQQTEDGDLLDEQLNRVIQTLRSLREKRSDLLGIQQENASAIDELRRGIADQEQKIASHGNWFATRLEELKLTHERLQARIETEVRAAEELAGGLLPFAVTPKWCMAVDERLKLEAEYEERLAAKEVIDHQLELLIAKFRSVEFWEDLDLKVSEDDKERLLASISGLLNYEADDVGVAASDVIHKLSKGDRRRLTNWIYRSTSEIPQLFRQNVSRIEKLEEELQRVEEDLALVPPDQILAPLVETLQRQNRELVWLQQKDQQLAEQIDGLVYELEQGAYDRMRLREQIAVKARQDHRIQLAHRSQLALADYSHRLTQEKTDLLEERLIGHFNELCRKDDVLSAVRIDPMTFRINLYRHRQLTEFDQLSAGEREILALATMWALREVSGLPMPIIIDTAFGRLDSVHRQRVTEKFLPRVSHQVVLLATDTEVDGYALDRLAPIISRVYHLEWDLDDGRSVLSETTHVCSPVVEKVGAE